MAAGRQTSKDCNTFFYLLVIREHLPSTIKERTIKTRNSTFGDWPNKSIIEINR